MGLCILENIVRNSVEFIRNVQIFQCIHFIPVLLIFKIILYKNLDTLLQWVNNFNLIINKPQNIQDILEYYIIFAEI